MVLKMKIKIPEGWLLSLQPKLLISKERKQSQSISETNQLRIWRLFLDCEMLFPENLFSLPEGYLELSSPDSYLQFG